MREVRNARYSLAANGDETRPPETPRRIKRLTL
jgi:hypothetical protein